MPIGLSLHECMLMAAVFSAADEVATLSLIKQVGFIAVLVLLLIVVVPLDHNVVAVFVCSYFPFFVCTAVLFIFDCVLLRCSSCRVLLFCYVVLFYVFLRTRISYRYLMYFNFSGLIMLLYTRPKCRHYCGNRYYSKRCLSRAVNGTIDVLGFPQQYRYRRY